MKRNRKSFPFILAAFFIAAIILRLILLNWVLQFWNNGDFSRYEDWARIAHVYSLKDTYTTSHLSVSKSFPNNQPPGSLYILSGTYEMYILIGKTIIKLTHTAAGSNLFVNTFLQHIIMRMPAMISDILMSVLAYLLVIKESGKKRALLASSLILFNPVIWYNSTIWGQMDSLNNLFFLLSIFAAYKNRLILSVMLFAASLYIKLSLLPLLPFYIVFIYLLSKKNIKLISLGILLSIAGILISTFPISSNPISWLLQEFPIIARGELQNITVAAFNFWWTITCGPISCKNIPVNASEFIGITLQTWGYVLFGFLSIPLIYLQISKAKEMITKENVFLLFALIALLVFLFLPTMHDRYMYPVFPLLAIAASLNKNIRWGLIIFICLSLLHFINLVYSWYPTYFPAFIFYQVIYSNLFRWSISFMTVVVGLIFYYKTIRGFIKIK